MTSTSDKLRPDTANSQNSKPFKKGSGCPDCGSAQYRQQEGCTLCPACGFSKCK